MNSTHWTSERAAQGVRAQFDDVLLKVVIENWWAMRAGKAGSQMETQMEMLSALETIIDTALCAPL